MTHQQQHGQHDNHDRQEQLRQELLEYYFDCHPDTDALAQRLEDDAELAALYEEVKLTAAVLETAATFQAPPLHLTPPTPAPRSVAGQIPVRRFGFRQVWYAAAAVFVIAFLPALGMYLHRAWQVTEVVNSKVSVLLSAPPAIPDGSPLRFHVETKNLAQQAAITQVDWKVLDAEGATLSESTTVCNGSTDITVAGTLNKPRRLIVTATEPGSGYQRTVEQPIHPSKSAPLVHLTSDKPAYRPGEPALLRVACLDRLTLRSADRIGLRCRIVDPKDAAVETRVLGVGKGVTAWTWKIPPSALGGNYALEVRDAKDEFTLERLEFLVRNFQPPKLKKKVTLDRQTYAAGDSGAADLHVVRAGGGAAAGAKVHATLVVDGDETWTDDAILDGEGRAVFQFDVPNNVRKGAGRFVARITDGGNVETELKPFVIPTETVEVLLYPEGGDLIAGTPNRVYAQVKDALGRPLSGAGRVVDDQGRVVAQFKTIHMGRTRFAFTPVMGRSYKVQLTSPKQKSFDLPPIHDTGAVLQPNGEFFAAGEPARVKVFTAGKGPWIASVFCRGVLVGQQSILRRGLSEVTIPLVDEASGVIRVTIFDRKMRPVAERLVQRDGKRNLTVAITPELSRVAPGAKQTIRIKATDETGEPVSCVVGLTVSDRAVADMLDFTRVGLNDQRQLFTDVEKPDEKVEEFLASAKQYRRNVDLLLGCLGWRRYVWRGDADEKALVAAGGDWAKALEVREGRSWAPLVTDTLASHQAELNVVKWSQQRAWALFVAFAAWALAGFCLLASIHGMVWISRRMQWRVPVVMSSAFTTAAVLFLALITWSQAASEGAVGILATATAMPTANFPSAGGVGATGSDEFFMGTITARDSTGWDLRATTIDGKPADEARSGRTRRSYAYVRDFDVQVAQGAVIMDELFDVSTNPITGSDMFYLETRAGGGGQASGLALTLDYGDFAGFRVNSAGRATGIVDNVNRLPMSGEWSFPLGNAARGIGGNYRGPGNVVPPAESNAVRATEQVVSQLVAVDRLRLRFLQASQGRESAARTTKLGKLQKEIQEKSVLLDFINRRYPAIFETLQPLVAGTVVRIDAAGSLVTIGLASGAENLKPGARLAIFNDRDGYKGEATVTEIDGGGSFCFARLELSNGKRIQAGDSASTNLTAHNEIITDAAGEFTVPAAKRRQIETILSNPVLAQAIYRYTHKAADSRRSFVETLFWQPFLVTNEKGEATVDFDVSDSVTTWKVFADAHGGGRVGQGEATFESFLPFSLDVKVPTRVSEGDKLQIPISIVADDKRLSAATLEIQADGPLQLKRPGERSVRLANGRGRALAELTIGKPEGNGAMGSISIRGQVKGATDTIGRQFVIVPRGFPYGISHAGNVKGKRELTLTVPDELARRTGVWTLRFYPSPLANLEEALQGMLREPSGCFEQVSSSNYPNVMILSLLESSGDNIPAAAAKAQNMLANGYKKLAAYEVDGGGFEWWGKKPAHAALTAYGLMQFTDMARVFDGVDPEMVARTRRWLLGKRDGKGGFVTGGGRYGHFMGGSPESRSAYIAFALLYAGETAANMKAEIDFLEQRAKRTGNAYELAVIACGLAKAGRPSAAAARQRLVKAQAKDGSLLGTGSITGSGTQDLRVETTAFAVLAWLSGGDASGKEHDDQVTRAVQFLEKSRQGGGHFGGTQATVMALKAVTAYMSANTKSVKPGDILVFVGDKQIARRQLFGSEKRSITLEHLAKDLVIGKNKVRIELTGGNEFPFSSELAYRADVPVSSQDCAVDLGTYLTKRVIAEGSTTALHAVLKNKTNAPVASPMVLIGLPAGLHVAAKILDDLKKSETIASWELTDRTIVLYLRGLQANEARDITIDLTGRIPGTSKGPASRAYLYYAGQEKSWVAPLEVTVTPAR